MPGRRYERENERRNKGENKRENKKENKKGNESLHDDYAAYEFETLTIANDFMFGAVMRNEDLCRRVLETILNVEIERIEFVNPQQTMDVAPDMKGVRLDVYVKDNAGTVYDVEMQVSDNKNLPLRIRYYHSIVDTDNLEKGMDYIDLPTSYVIFICTFDPIGSGRAYYSFSTRCDQDGEIVLEDRRRTVFLNTKGEKSGVSPALGALLDYFNGHKADNPLVDALDSEVKRKRMNKQMKEDVMIRDIREMDITREAMAIGEARGEARGAVGMLRDMNIPESEIARRVKEKYKLTDEQVNEFMCAKA